MKKITLFFVLSFITIVSFAKSSNSILEKNAELHTAQENKLYNNQGVKIEENSLLLVQYMCYDVTVIYSDGSSGPGILCRNMSDCNTHPADCNEPDILVIQ